MRKAPKLLVVSALVAFCAALVTFGYVVHASKALSYLSKDPEACVNCHVMTTQFTTWQHSAHARHATCIDCHLPVGDEVAKYTAKARDGWNHSVAFTLNSYQQAIVISDDGASRVQANCVRCHAKLTAVIRENADLYHNFDAAAAKTDRLCWDCHKGVPHGKVRSLSATPHTLSVNASQ